MNRTAIQLVRMLTKEFLWEQRQHLCMARLAGDDCPDRVVIMNIRDCGAILRWTRKQILVD